MDPLQLKQLLADNLLSSLQAGNSQTGFTANALEDLTSALGDIGVSKPLNWQDYYVEGTASFKKIFPSKSASNVLAGSGFGFEDLDRRTQFCLLFSEWVECEMMGQFALSKNDLAEAENCFMECMQRADQLAVNILKAKSAEGLLSIAEKTGDRPEQRKRIDEALAFYGTDEDELAKLRLMSKQAMLDTDEGRLIQAEKALDSILVKVAPPKNGHEANLYRDCLIQLATLKRFQNRWPEALELLDLCKDECAKGQSWQSYTDMVRIYFIYAQIYLTKAAPEYDPDKANEAINNLRGLNFDSWMVDELETDLAIKKGDWRAAAHLIPGVIRSLEREGWLQGVAAKRLHAAQAFLQLGELDKAEQEIGQSLTHLKKNGPPDLYAAALRTQAELRGKKGDHRRAWNTIQDSLDEIENLIRFQNSLYAQQQFLLDKLDYYETAFRLALQLQGEEGIIRAWQTVERSKSFYICQLVASNEVALFEGIPADDSKQLRELDRKLDELETRIGLNRRNEPLLQPLLEEQARQFQEKKQVVERIMQDNPRWASIRKPSVIDLAGHYKALEGWWTFVSYYWKTAAEGQELYIFYFDRNGSAKVHVEQWTADELQKFKAKADLLLSPGIKLAFDNLIPPKFGKKIFPAEVLNNIREGSSLLISPSGILKGLPLHMLPVQEQSRLIDLHPVQYIPTFALLDLQDRTPAHRDRGLFIGCAKNAFGDPELKDVPQELQMLAGQFQANGRHAEQVMVAESETLEQRGFPPERWSDMGHIHISCHGSFPPEDPMSASLRIGKQSVRGTDLFHCKLNADMVVFSACDLGRQDLKPDGSNNSILQGEEWVGMYLPLFYAGARHILVSLWTANAQQTPPFMMAFNEHLLNGTMRSHAFQKACLALQNQPASFWGNWYLVGFPYNKT